MRDVKNGDIDNIQQLLDRFVEINDNYSDYRWAWSYQMILDYYGLEEITEEDVPQIHDDYIKARRAWIEKEYQMGDVELEVYEDFLSKLDHEIDYEN